MTTSTIRQKLYDYIRVANDKKVKAIYTILEEEISEIHDYWNDKDFIAELDKHSADYKRGKVKAVPWKEAKEQIIGSTKKGAK